MERRNFIKNIVKGLVGLPLISSCDNPNIEIYEGKIIKEQFTPATTGWGGFPDKYEIRIEFPNGNTKDFNEFRDKARKLNLKYNVGDSIIIKRIQYSYDYGVKYKIDDEIIDEIIGRGLF